MHCRRKTIKTQNNQPNIYRTGLNVVHCLICSVLSISNTKPVDNNEGLRLVCAFQKILQVFTEYTSSIKAKMDI